MDDILETDDMTIELRLAAVVALLSASALRGPTAAKAAALRAHLAAALGDRSLAPPLREAIDQALAGWRAVACHPASVSVALCPLTAPGQSIH
ncbi:MAG: hypothetical protein PHD19_13180 [Dechloromonas sp.]|nr:hypothetical protein [Dechloromonas sp.]